MVTFQAIFAFVPAGNRMTDTLTMIAADVPHETLANRR
ncbi:hypothetical protein I603_1688 [Erythrobacter dokdonensis DSW-74]|uniref:Uncharacterized protein n=1 Tax=Erythrobacter dokdonensis DSW-74 TaxID=1300349 RepID=A0A1A7BJA9_9SPHN|nr:hypothetical protein I603_1688 [Erythrobacter dokdonensis DSW-74]